MQTAEAEGGGSAGILFQQHQCLPENKSKKESARKASSIKHHLIEQFTTHSTRHCEGLNVPPGVKGTPNSSGAKVATEQYPSCDVTSSCLASADLHGQAAGKET